jgi:hypothetical protein
MPSTYLDGDALHTTRGYISEVTVTGTTSWTGTGTLFTLPAAAHYTGAMYKLRFMARIAAGAVTTETYSYRINLGGTAGPNTVGIHVNSADEVVVEGEITLIYTAAGSWRSTTKISNLSQTSTNSTALVESAISGIIALNDQFTKTVELEVLPSQSTRSITFDSITFERIC